MWRSRRKPSWRSCVSGRNRIITEKVSIPEERSQRDWQRVLPGLAISVVSLAVVLYFADLEEFQNALRLADYRLVAASLLITLAWLVVRSFAWRALLQDRASFGQVFLTLNEGYLLNNLLPFRLGEVARAFLLGRKAALDFWQVMSTIFIERALDLLLAAGLLLITLPFVVGASWAGPAAVAAGIIVICGLVFLYLLARNRNRALASFEWLAGRWPFLYRLGGRALPAFLTGLGVLTNFSQFLRAVLLILLNWVIALGQYYLLMRAFFPEAQLLWAAFSLGVAALGIAVPSSPGSIGVMEASVVGALTVFGLDPSVALAFVLIVHLIQYLLTGAIGAYGLVRDGESLFGLFRQLRSEVKDLSTRDTKNSQRNTKEEN